MSDDKQDRQGLPFRLFDSVLGRMKKLVDTTSDVARDSVGRGGGALRARAAEGDGEDARSETASSEARDGAPDEPAVPGTPAPSETATASAALATALDEEAKAAIAKHAGQDGEVTDGLAIKDQSGRVPPDEELGPEPFTPQVGP